MKITPEVVEKAYKELGLKPITKKWFEYVDMAKGYEINCACPVTAYYCYAFLGSNCIVSKNFDVWLYRYNAYTNGFVAGFDNHALRYEFDNEVGEQFKEGRSDGQLVRQHLIDKGLLKV